MKSEQEQIYSMTIKEAENRAKAHETEDSWDLWEDMCKKKDMK